MTTTHDRHLLGSADVDEAELTAMVADLLGHPPAEVEVVSSRATPVDYDIPSITTVGRFWVNGTARTPDGEQPFRMFVKHVQAWHHSPFFAFVPEEARDFARTTVPWRTEAEVYRSDLADRLPQGLTLPRALGVHDRDPDAVVMWLEASEHPVVAWDSARYERAAHLLGRMSGSSAVAPLAGVGAFDWHVLTYVFGRLVHDVVPTVMGDEAWRRPVVAEEFGDLQDRMRAACGRLEAYAHELAALPQRASHGDACPNNLLPGRTSDDFVLIDFGFWMPQAVGFDLGQLVGGEIQLGRLPAIDLADLDERCLIAHHEGLAAEGFDVDLDVLRRAHALQLLVFSGISSLPTDGPDEMDDDHVRARAVLARHSFDLLEQTGG